MKDLFYEVLEEAADGKILIDGEEWPIAFNSFVYRDGKLVVCNNNNDNLSCLVINDEEKFLNILDEYLDLEIKKKRRCISFSRNDINTYKKFLISYLMVNASTEDFRDPVGYLRRTISFLDDETFFEFNDGILFKFDGLLSGLCLKVKNCSQGVMMETPRRMEISIVKECNDIICEYKLPSVSYGIYNDECYVYSLLNPKEKQNVSEEEYKFSKKIGRTLYKINSGVESKEDEMSDISKVSPSSVLSLVVFISLLKNVGINDVKGVPYLPVRYLSRDIVADEMTGDRKDEFLERNLQIQKNVTDKFIRTFMRAAYHLEDCDVMMMPYELDECVYFRIGNRMNSNNKLLQEAVNATRGR